MAGVVRSSGCVIRREASTELASWFVAGPDLRVRVQKGTAVGKKLFKVRRLSLSKKRFASQCL